MRLVAALVVLAALLLAAVCVLVLYLTRQRTLSRRVGSFGCGLRDDGSVAWVSGTAQYATGRLLWWRSLSLAPRPEHSWSRAELDLLERVLLEETGDDGLPLLLVRCIHRGRPFELTMSVQACAGLVSWLEAGPRAVGRVI